MITLYALKQSRAYRIAWLLEILQLDYQAKILTRHPDTLKRQRQPDTVEEAFR